MIRKKCFDIKNHLRSSYIILQITASLYCKYSNFVSMQINVDVPIDKTRHKSAAKSSFCHMHTFPAAFHATIFNENSFCHYRLFWNTVADISGTLAYAYCFTYFLRSKKYAHYNENSAGQILVLAYKTMPHEQTDATSRVNLAGETCRKKNSLVWFILPPGLYVTHTRNS